MEHLKLSHLTIEHQKSPLGIDCTEPRFAWVLESELCSIVQKAYQLVIISENEIMADTGKMESEDSIEVRIAGFTAEPKTVYFVKVTVWDNEGHEASIQGMFETGRLDFPWNTGWVEPEQEPTKSSLEGKKIDMAALSDNPNAGQERDFAEFQPAQYIRIPFDSSRVLKKARVYATAHGIYKLEVNGVRPDDRELAPENTSYRKLLQYQTYDVTHLIKEGRNVFGIILADGWWTGRVGLTGDCCQYGEKTGLLFETELTYEDGTKEIVTGENGVSSTGPIIFSDLFVGEKYDATEELDGWSTPEFDDKKWKPVNAANYAMDNLRGQYGEPIRPVNVLKPKTVLHTPAGETVLDVGQVLAGQVEFTVNASAGMTIKLEHTEILDEDGNFFNNIIGVNKEQTDIYITKEGMQTYRPMFSYHGFRYVKITGWPGELSAEDFKIYVLTSEMEDIGSFTTSNEKINQLQHNIWWSQVSNTISIPTDCPQRERAGWTGDIMAFAPTLTFNRQADAFLTRWMANVRADQLENGAVPMIVPYLDAYREMAKSMGGTDTSCGWGDAVIRVPLAVYRAYGDRKILEDNYEAMKRWMKYIDNRAENCHPKDYETWGEERKRRSRYLWNTDFHYGDWLVPSMVLGNPDGMAMIRTAFATMGIVAPAYYAFSARSMVQIAEALGEKEDAAYYQDLFEKIAEAFIEEYVHDDGTMAVDLQGIYVIALKNNLVTEELRPKMTAHLCELIERNRGCLDTGFLSVLFLMDVLCENGCRETAYKLLYQNKCPSWLYEVEHGATTMWESWGAIGEDGKVSTYSFNHYAFGCIGEWMYRELGGLQMLEPGYKKIRIAPALECGLTKVKVSEYTPYGEAAVTWEKDDKKAEVIVTIPCNTSAEVDLPGMEIQHIGSGTYSFVCYCG